MIDVPTNRVERIATWFTPSALAYNNVAGKLYCAGVYEREIAVLDGASNEVLRFIPVSEEPHVLTLAPDVNKLYYGSSATDPGWVDVIDCGRDTVVKSLEVGYTLAAMCYNPNRHKLYCSEGGDGWLFVFDVVSDSLVATVQLDDPANAMVYNNVLDRLYVAEAGAGQLSVIDCTADSVVDTLSLGRNATSLVYNPRYDLLFCALGSGESVVAVRCGTGQIAATISVGQSPSAMALNRDGSKLYVVSGSVAVGTVIDCASLVSLKTINTLHPVDGLALDTIADKVYGFESYDGFVMVIDCGRDSIVRWLYDGGYPVALAWNPAMRRMYAANSDSSSISVFRDSAVAGMAGQSRGLEARRTLATVVRGVLFLPRGPGHEPQATSVLLDISGRKVLDLGPGENDVRALPAGVYFVRQAASNATTKVVVER